MPRTPAKPSKSPEPTLGEIWNNPEYEFGSPELEIMGRFDLYQDGDWQEAIRAAIVALENDLPFPKWARNEVAGELRRAIKLEPLPPKRKAGRSARGRQLWADRKNQLCVVCAVEAAEAHGFEGMERYEEAFKALTDQEIPVGTVESVKTSYNRHHKKMANEPWHDQYCLIFFGEFEKRLGKVTPG